GQVVPAPAGDAAPLQPGVGGAERLELLVALRLLDQAGHPAGVVPAHDTDPAPPPAGDGQDGDGRVGAAVAARLPPPPEVPPVDLVGRQDQDVVAAGLLDVAEVLADGVGGAGVPLGRLVGLLRRQDLHEAAAERVELVGVGDVAVQADAEELRQDVDTAAAAV